MTWVGDVIQRKLAVVTAQNMVIAAVGRSQASIEANHEAFEALRWIHAAFKEQQPISTREVRMRRLMNECVIIETTVGDLARSTPPPNYHNLLITLVENSFTESSLQHEHDSCENCSALWRPQTAIYISMAVVTTQTMICKDTRHRQWSLLALISCFDYCIKRLTDMSSLYDEDFVTSVEKWDKWGQISPMASDRSPYSFSFLRAHRFVTRTEFMKGVDVAVPFIHGEGATIVFNNKAHHDNPYEVRDMKNGRSFPMRKRWPVSWKLMPWNKRS